jgi:ferritin-like metal-binding protein YciE
MALGQSMAGEHFANNAFEHFEFAPYKSLLTCANLQERIAPTPFCLAGLF